MNDNDYNRDYDNDNGNENDSDNDHIQLIFLIRKYDDVTQLHKGLIKFCHLGLKSVELYFHLNQGIEFRKTSLGCLLANRKPK